MAEKQIFCKAPSQSLEKKGFGDSHHHKIVGDKPLPDIFEGFYKSNLPINMWE